MAASSDPTISICGGCCNDRRPAALRRATTLPVDARALSPDRAGRQDREPSSHALALLVGNREVPLGELAEVTAGDADSW